MGLDTVELVFAVEKRFSIEIPDREAAALATVGMLHAWIVDELNRLCRPNVDANMIFLEHRELICHQLGVKSDAVVPEAHFVNDLSAD